MCTICWTLVIWWWKSIIRFLIKARWNNGLFYETAVCGKRSNLNLHGTKSLQSHSPLYFWFVLVLLPHWCLCVHYCDSSTPLSTLWPDSIPMLIGSATDKHTSFVCLSLYYLTLRGINNTASSVSSISQASGRREKSRHSCIIIYWVGLHHSGQIKVLLNYWPFAPGCRSPLW